MHLLPELMLAKAEKAKLDERTHEEITADLYFQADRLFITPEVTSLIAKANVVYQADPEALVEFKRHFETLASQIDQPDNAFMATMLIEHSLAHAN